MAKDWSPRPALFTAREISDLLTTAFEGGSNYWIQSVKYIPPAGMNLADLKREAWKKAPDSERELWRNEGPTGRWPLYAMLGFVPKEIEWKMKIAPTEDEESVYLTPVNMQQAANKVLKDYPHIYARIKEGQYDANDADVWLQLAVFNDVVFG